MSEFGNDSASAAFRFGTKAADVGVKSVEVLFEFLKFLIERKEKNIAAAIQKEKLNELKLNKSVRDAKLEIDNKVGYVKAKALQKTKEPLTAINMSLDSKQMKEFAKYAKKYGLVYTSISDKGLDGKKSHLFFVREKDLKIAKLITDRMTENLQLKSIDDKIAEIQSKPVLSKQDLADIEYLKNQKSNIIQTNTKAFNDENNKVIFEEICGGMEESALSFDRALNRFTDRDFSRDTPYYVCERTNPNSYIELISQYDSFRNEEYTRTDYKVFNDDTLQGEFSDRRFEGRPKYYWKELKTEMKNKGNFSDDIVVFNSKAEFDRYKDLYAESIKENTIIENVTEFRDYPNFIEQLKIQLDKYGAELNENGFAIDKESKKLIDITNTNSDVESLKIAEIALITKQIANYDKLNDLNTQIEMESLELENIENNLMNPNMDINSSMYKSLSERRDNLINNIKSCEADINKGIILENKLNFEKNQLSGIYAVMEVETEYNSKLIGELENYENSFNYEELLDSYSEEMKMNDAFNINNDDRDLNFGYSPSDLSLNDWKSLIAEQKSIDAVAINGSQLDKTKAMDMNKKPTFVERG